jgi:hypothetical protein
VKDIIIQTDLSPFCQAYRKACILPLDSNLQNPYDGFISDWANEHDSKEAKRFKPRIVCPGENRYCQESIHLKQ